ncbi:MAG: glycine zipper 2TM domain-containing protein [Bryobacteraceae bacterium]
MYKVQRYLIGILVSAGLLIGSAAPAVAQHRGTNKHQNHSSSQHQNYYGGMQDSVRKGNFARYANNDKRRDQDNRDQHNKGGIGPGKAALIGGAGGAALGALFGGGLKGTLIGGAAGAGIGAIVGEATKGNDHHRNSRGRQR